MEKPVNLKFKNQINPKSSFDMLRLEDLFQREILDHDIEKLHRVEFFIIILITEGTGIHRIDFKDYKYKKGTILTIRKDQIHKFQKEKGTKGYILLFLDDFLVSYLEKLATQQALQLFNELLDSPKIQLKSNEFSTIHCIFERIENEYRNTYDDYSLGIIRSELHILITKLDRIKSGKLKTLENKKYLSKFIAFQSLVESHATQSFGVIDYARLMAISTKTLNTITKSIVRKSAKAFIDEIRTTQIKRLLINTSLSIKEIAHHSGFEESTNFYKYFKRQMGMTPESFRGLV